MTTWTITINGTENTPFIPKQLKNNFKQVWFMKKWVDTHWQVMFNIIIQGKIFLAFQNKEKLSNPDNNELSDFVIISKADWVKDSPQVEFDYHSSYPEKMIDNFDDLRDIRA